MKNVFTLLLLLTCSWSLVYASDGDDEDKEGESKTFFEEKMDSFYEEVKKDYQVHAYPNPSSGVVFVELRMDQAKEERAALEVYDLIGKRVYTHGFENFRVDRPVEINLSEHPQGIYFVKVTLSDNTVLSRKIILDK